MLAVTHLIVSLLFIHLLTLDRNDAFVALMFGVFIDVDHLFGLKAYVDVHGIAGLFDFDSLMNADGQWKSMLHNPVAALVVGPAASASRLALPLLFWFVHITMDYAEDSFLGLFSLWETLLLAGSAAALFLLSYRKVRFYEPDIGLMEFVGRGMDSIASRFGRVRRAVFRPRAQ